jgi:O-antigen/teichoic acid export membrane protein
LQLRVRHIARNVIFSWVGTIALMAVGFFLSPFILHHLGNLDYGVWVMAISVVGYLGLLDFGLQSSVLRFVSKGHTQGDHQSSSRALSAVVWVRLQISALMLLLSFALAAVFPFLFKIPAALASDARLSIVLIGFTAAISTSVGSVGAVLAALNRYDLTTYVAVAQNAIRVIGVVLVLRSGHGIVAIALCELVASISGNLLLVWMARGVYPELRIKLKKPDREILRQIWSYSSYSFLTMIAVQLVYQSDNLVVGAFVSASAVTFYAIANSLGRYVTQLIGAMANTFVPAASTFEAAGDNESLLRLYKNGTRLTIMISVPILITLIVRGSGFIGLWMGQQYAHSSGIVLIILSVGLLLAFANRTAGSIAFGIEKHKAVALWAVGEGVANLVLSVTLVHWYGIYGVALGTLIPSVIVHVIFWPRYISKLVGVSAFDVVWNVWAPIFLASVPFAIASYAIEVFFPARNLAIFFLQVIATLAFFFLPVAIVFRGFVRSQIFPRVRSMFLAEAK